MRLARFLAAFAVLLLVLVLFNVITEGFESPWPFAAVTALWLAVYFLIDRAASRRIRAADARSRRNAVRVGACAAAGLGLFLSLISAGLSLRYAMTPLQWRRIHRELHSEQLQIGKEPGAIVAFAYSKPNADLRRVIFIHGTPGNVAGMAHFALKPIDGLECVAVDRPGFGHAASWGAVTSFKDQAAVLAELLVDRPTGKPILVGHSLGGPIAACIAADYPDRVGGLVILAGSLDPGLEVPRWYNDAIDLQPNETKMASNYQNSNAEIKAAESETRALAKRLDRITCPVRILHGDADDLVPVENVGFMKRALVNSSSVEVTILPGERHGIHKTREDLIRSTIVELAAWRPDSMAPDALPPAAP